MLLGLLSFLFSRDFVLCVTLLSPVMYLVLNSLLPLILGTQDLKKKYNAKWALVTGSSSGMGKELARKLLFQGLDVIMVARDEPLFKETVKELAALFPQRQVVQVPANLSDESGKWMDAVKEAVGDKSVQVVFLNAGYILTGMYEANPASAHLANFHCNLTANVHLSHFLYSRMLAAGETGCIVFTSSSASYIPNPFAVMYGATKAGLSSLAAALAVEGRARGIHVHAIHPSPVNSRFSSGGGNAIKLAKIEAMDQFYKFATGPEALPDQFFAHIGRGGVIADLGGVSMGLRMVVHVLGYNLMAFATALTAPLMPDYQNNVAKAVKKS